MHAPLLTLGRDAEGKGPPPKPRDTTTVPDADLHFQRRPHASLRQSAMPAPPSPPLEESARGVSTLRQSALPADSARGRAITTMENADVDATIAALAAVIRAYTREASRKQRRKLVRLLD